MQDATLTATSTAPPPATGVPDSAPEVQNQAPTAETKPSKPLSLEDRVKVAKEEFRSKGKEGVKTGDAPVEPVEENVEGEAEVQELSSEPLETISYKGKDAPISDVLDEATFEVFSQDKMHPVEGIKKLMDFAAMGIAAAEKNRVAKEAVVKAQDVIREVEAGVAKSVESQLNELLNNALRGTNANGQPFQNESAQKRAVELATQMKNEFDNGRGEKPQAQRSFTEEDVANLVQKKLDEHSRKSSEESTRKDIVQGSQKAIMDLTKADPAFFVKPDGKMNTKLYDSYRSSLMNESNQAWLDAGSPMDVDSIKNIIAKTRAELLPEFKISNGTAETKQAVRSPIVKPSSGAGIVPGSADGKAPKFRTPGELIAYKKQQLGLGKKR